MKKTIYYTFKIGLGVYIAFLLSNFLGLQNPISAAIITILSVKETRKKSIYISAKRFLAGNIAILLSFGIFSLIGFRLEGLVLLLLIYIPFAFYINAKESIISGFVLASHVLAFESISLGVYIEENLILIIGILTGFFLIIHMPDIEKDLLEYKEKIEKDFSSILFDMSLSLKNLCYIGENNDLEALEQKIKKAKSLSYEFKENNLVGAKAQYIDYFQMRLIQLYRLMYMRDHLNEIFITQEQAVPLSKITKYISEIIGKEPEVETLLEKIDRLKKHYKNEPLPSSRIEFENRSVLFQYLNDLEEFLKIKQRYLINKK
ncbi:MAG TPA: aromatic acid exporter family protein [Clostridia bacterium]|nr:aromatic acid exporter family protein [Clostridia bacterium]